MRALRTTVLFPAALLGVALLLTGCGGASTPPPPAPGTPPTVATGTPPTVATGAPPAQAPAPAAPDPLTATPPDGTTALDPARVEARDLPPGFPTLVWTRGPRTLGVYGRAGGCTEASAQVVDQGAESVTLRVVQATTSTGPCTRELRYPPLEVTLAADLGTRRVVLTGEVR
jgi:ABC-type transport system substrate-binding protein